MQLCIYHLLRGAFSEQVAVSQVIDLDVLHVVTVRDVHFLADGVCLCFSRLPSRRAAALNRRCVDMLNALSSLHGSIDPGGGGSWLTLVSRLTDFAPAPQDMY